jgi:hypothetical protein
MINARVNSARSSSHDKIFDDENNKVILGSILSRKSWSNSLHRHLPFSNRWKERYFVIENSSMLSIISSGRRINLLVEKMTLSNHDYSPDGSNVFAISYYTDSSNQNALGRSNSPNRSAAYFSSGHVKELEILLQFPLKTDMISCKSKLLLAIRDQRINSDQSTERAVKIVSSFLKKRLHIQSILSNTIDSENIYEGMRSDELSATDNIRGRDDEHKQRLRESQSFSLTEQSRSDAAIKAADRSMGIRCLSSDSVNSTTLSSASLFRLKTRNDIHMAVPSSSASAVSHNFGPKVPGPGFNFASHIPGMRGIASSIPAVSPMRLAISLASSVAPRGNNSSDSHFAHSEIAYNTTSGKDTVPMVEQFIERDEDDYSIIDNVPIGRALESDSKGLQNNGECDLSRVRTILENNRNKADKILGPGASSNVLEHPHTDLVHSSLEKLCDINEINRKNPLHNNENMDVNNDKNNISSKNTPNESMTQNQRGDFYDADIWKEGQLDGLSDVLSKSKFLYPSTQPETLLQSAIQSSRSPPSLVKLKSFEKKSEMNDVEIQNENENDAFIESENYLKFHENMGSSSFFSIPIPKMRILLMSVGTFGDVQPFATLGTVRRICCCLEIFCIPIFRVV